MLEYSIIGKIYSYWQYSTIYSLIARVYHFLAKAFKCSLIRRILTFDGKMEKYIKTSFFARVSDGIIELLFRIIRAIEGFLKKAWKSSRIVALSYHSVILKFDFMLVAWIVLMYAVPHSFWNNGYSVIAVFGLFAVYFVLCGLGKRQLVSPKEFGPAFVVFAIVTVTSNLYTTERADSLRVTIFFFVAFLLFWMIRSYADTRDKLEIILGCIYAVTIFTAAFGIGQRLAGVEVNPIFIDSEINPGIPARVFSTVDNPNNFAELIVLFAPAACVFAMTRKNMLARFILCCSMGIPMIALLMTYSRSGWLSIALCVFIFVYYSNKRIIPWIFVAGMVLIPFLPASILTRLGNLVNIKDSSASFRLTLWESVLRLLSMGNRWLTGIGLGSKTYSHNIFLVSTRKVAEGMPHTQMLYLELFMGWGIMGFISFMSFILAKLKDCANSIFRSSDELIRGSLIGSLSAFLGIAILAIFEYIWFYPRILFAYFILLGIMTAGIDLSKKKQ